VISQGDGGGHVAAQGPQGGEELLGPADPREGQRAQARPGHPRGERAQLAAQALDVEGPPARVEGGLRGRVADRQQEVRAREGGRHGLAQGARRQDRAVAPAALGVHDHERQVLPEMGVLVPVVQQDRAGARRHGRARPGRAVARDPGGQEGGQQEGLVAHLAGVVAHGVHLQGTLEAPPVAPRDGVGARGGGRRGP
jgi:hypothetical protein